MVGFAIALLLSGSSEAHELWLQPDSFWTQPEQSVSLTLQVGDESSQQRSQIRSRRITRFASISSSGEFRDRRGDLQLHGEKQDGELQFQQAGTYVVVMETDNAAESHLPADRFNQYLKDEGLTPALEHRQMTDQDSAEGRERYSRRAKALLHVGPAAAAIHTAGSTPAGLSLEIVPAVNPYAEPRPRLLPLQVFYKGSPLSGALVKLIDLQQHLTPIDEQRTDDAGTVRFDMPGSGEWLLAVAWTEVLPETETVDFETTFSTLSFGFPVSP